MGSLDQKCLPPAQRVLPVGFVADRTKVAAPVSVILEDWMRWGKEGMRNVSWFDAALDSVASAMDVWNDDRDAYSPLLFSARLNFLLASAALMRLLESKSSLFTGGSAFLPLRDPPVWSSSSDSPFYQVACRTWSVVDDHSQPMRQTYNHLVCRKYVFGFVDIWGGILSRI